MSISIMNNIKMLYFDRIDYVAIDVNKTSKLKEWHLSLMSFFR